MQRIWWLNSTLSAKVHLMTFDLYNYQTPDGQIAEQVKNAQETLGYQKIIVPKIPPGGEGAIASSKSIKCVKVRALFVKNKVRFAVSHVRNNYGFLTKCSTTVCA